jgi:hypothetical protein
MGVLARRESQTATGAFSARVCMLVGEAAERAKKVVASRVRRWVVCIFFVLDLWLVWCKVGDVDGEMSNVFGCIKGMWWSLTIETERE